MKKIILLLLTITLILFTNTKSQTSDSLRSINNKAFRSGEKLYFDIDYGFITVGKAELSIPEADSIFNRKVYHVISIAKSMPFFDMFFKVRDRYESFIDSIGIFSWRFEQHVREGKYKRDYGAFLNQIDEVAISDTVRTKIPRYTQDIISAFYFTRTVDFSGFTKGNSIKLFNFFGNKVYPLKVVFRGKETIETDAGEFRCIVIEPLVTEGGLFKNEGRILIWLTDDDAKMPVLVKSKVLIGSITAELTKYENVYGKLTSKITVDDFD